MNLFEIKNLRNFLDELTQELYVFFNSNENPYNKESGLRPLLFEIEMIPQEGRIPKINAYCEYTEKEDKIVICLGLIEELYEILSLPLVNGEVRGSSKMKVLYALSFVLYHEFFHLYAGHIQIATSNKFYMDEDISIDTINSNVDKDVLIRSMEMQADDWAACQLISRVCTGNNPYYYIDDVLCGIQGLFHIFRALENDSTNFDSECKGDHLFSASRNIHIIHIMNEHAKKQFEIDFKIDNNYMREKFLKNNFSFQKHDRVVKYNVPIRVDTN